MKYGRVKQGVFLERPNRFVARVEIQGTVETVHVKNTGRCGELLLPGAAVYLEDHGDAMGSRKTRYDLIAVEKRIPAKPGKKEKTLLINMDSQAPNKVVAEALRSGGILLPGFPGEIGLLKPESVFGVRFLSGIASRRASPQRKGLHRGKGRDAGGRRGGTFS